MKKKACLLLIASSMVLSGCSWKDLMFWKKWGKKNNEPEQQEPAGKTITGILEVHAPGQIEQGQSLTSVQVKVSYSDGSSAVVTSTRVELDTSQTGTITGTAYVDSFSATFTIEVYSNNMPTHHGTFVSTSATAGIGYTDITLTNESSDTIQVRAEKVSMNGSNIIASKNSYFVLYNKVTSPLNDVYDVKLNWANVPVIDGNPDSGYAIYFSYNFLTVEDIFGGYYQDLEVEMNSVSLNGSDDSISTKNDDSSSQKARYFLMICQTCETSDMSFTGMQVISNNSEAPDAVDKGTYAYPSEIAGKFPGFVNNSLPFIGNGSIKFSESGELFNFSALQKQGKYAWLLSQFEANGFVYATELMGMSVYQKEYNDTLSYTYAFTFSEFEDFEIISMISAGLYTTMIEETSWPGDELKAAIPTTAYRAYITDPGFTGNVSYITAIENEDTEKEAGVMINNKDENQKAQFAANGTIIKNYLHNLITNSGFTSSSEYGGDFTGDEFYYSATIKSPDMKFEVSATVMYADDSDMKMMSLTYKERIYGAFPTALVREEMFSNTFPVLVSANGEYTYTTSNTGIDINALGVTKAELDAYWAEIGAFGYSVSDSESSNYHYYSASKLIVNENGAFNMHVYAYLYDDYVRIVYSRSTASTINFGSAMKKISSSLCDAFATAVGEDFNNGQFIVDTENHIIYAIGYGQTEANVLLAACQYDATIGTYVFFNDENTSAGAVRISVEVMSNYLVIHAYSISSHIWNIYHDENCTNNVNGMIDALFEDSSQSGASDYHFDTNSLKFYRYSYSSEIYAFGANVEEVINSYKTALMQNTDIDYSAYLNKYINRVTGVAISFDMNLNEPLPYVLIRFTFGETYIDYQSYSSIVSNLAPFEHLDSFPALNVLSGDPEAFVVSYCNSDSAYLYVTAEEYEAYKATIEADTNYGLLYSDTYEYVDADGNRATVSFSSYSNQISLNFEENYYTTISAISAEYEANSFTFAENILLPSQSGKIFRSSYYYGNYCSIDFAVNLFDKEAYINELLAAGYVASYFNSYSDEVMYAKTVGSTCYYVQFGSNSITYGLQSFSPTSYSAFVETLDENNFDVDKLDEFVTLSAMENSYCYDSAWTTEFSVTIANSSVTLEAYQTALLNAGYEYISKTDTYEKENIQVSIRLVYGFLKITYRDTRIIYKSFAKVVEMAAKSGFDTWRLNYVLAPSQTGDIYGFSTAWSQSMTFNYNPEVFDVNAYKAELIAAGYSVEGSNYSKGEAHVYISTSSHYIQLNYTGSNS